MIQTYFRDCEEFFGLSSGSCYFFVTLPGFILLGDLGAEKARESGKVTEKSSFF